jgi:hypothetical protein
MSLEFLKNEEKKANYDFDILDNYSDEYENITKYLNLDLENNSLSIKFQSGPRKEVGVNGTQIDVLLLLISHMIDYMNFKFPCKENVMTISHITAAMHYLQERTQRRIIENKEGLSIE